ncbi:MAG: hypothetical protein F6J86_09905 [Symploca sp. SIO1B1]|nr:hypothetical protein [Symploca sp. SIO1B1]
MYHLSNNYNYAILVGLLAKYQQIISSSWSSHPPPHKGRFLIFRSRRDKEETHPQPIRGGEQEESRQGGFFTKNWLLLHPLTFDNRTEFGTFFLPCHLVFLVNLVLSQPESKKPTLVSHPPHPRLVQDGY